MCKTKRKMLEEIIQRFSRYTIRQRIAICQYLSFCAAYKFGEYNTLANGNVFLLPHEAETLSTIILLNLDKQSSKISYFPSSQFWYDLDFTIVCFSKLVPPHYKKLTKKYGPYSILGPAFAKQISYQRYAYTKMYRFYYIFNYDKEMKSFFTIKTNVDNYLDYSVLAQTQSAYYSDKYDKGDIFDFCKYQILINTVCLTNEDKLKKFTITIEKLKQLQKDKCNIKSLEELYYSYKQLSDTPFIQINESNYPISTISFDYTFTEGLFLSITDFEEKIKTKIGKPILEQYVYHLFEESNLYQIPDIKSRNRDYKYKGKSKHPADAIIKNEDTVLIIEVKEKVYNRRFLINDEDVINKEYEKAENGIKQLLNYYAHFKLGSYNPFKDEKDKNKEIYIVMIRLFYLPFNYDKLIEDVISDPNYKEYGEYLKTHLLIADIDLVELFCLHRQDLISAIKMASRNNELSSLYKFRKTCYPNERTPSFKRFMYLLGNRENEQINKMKTKISKEH